MIVEGDSVAKVKQTSGAPTERHVIPPAGRTDGGPKLNAAETQFRVYAPQNDAYRHLKFIDGRMVEIRTEHRP